MEEKVFFERNNNKVTNARFITNGQTYALAGLTSVKMTETLSKWKVFLQFMGFVFIVMDLMNQNKSNNIGLLILGGLLMWIGTLITPEYHIVTVSAGGESQALTSKDKTLIVGIVNAINDAIVYRG